MKMAYLKNLLILFFLFASVSSVFAASPAFRIEIGKEGIYYINYETLYDTLIKSGYTSSEADAFLLSISSNALLMKNRGEEIPIYVSDYGLGQFSDKDYIVFYGTGIEETLNSEHRFTNEYRYTRENVYYLTTGDEQGRLRIKSRDGKPVNGTQADMFMEKYHGEEDTKYWEGLPDGEGRDHWFWDSKIYSGETRTFPPFNLNNLASTNKTFLLRYSLQGRTDDFNVNPDHHIQIFLNDKLIKEEKWDGIWADKEGKHTDLTHEVTDNIQSSLLMPAGNIIKIKSIGEPGTVNGMGATCIGEPDTAKPCNAVYFNYFEIEYYKNFTAENDVLKFSDPSVTGVVRYNISNISSGDAEIYDITDPLNIYMITGAAYNPAKKMLSFSDDVPDYVKNKKTYIALTLSERNNNIPTVELARQPVLTDTNNQADYIMITHEDFMDAADVLAAHREGRGLKTKIADIKDIYEEFSNGIVTPQAIRDFLDYAYHSWTAPAPLYVLLLGDANIDYRDNWKYQETHGDKSFIPVKMLQSNIPGIGEIPSDNWYVTLKNKDGDYDIFPDMFIGRLPARTHYEATNMINKIISQEISPLMEWGKRILFIAGNYKAGYDPDYSNPTFVELADDLATFIPPGFYPVKLYADNYNEKDPAMKTDLFNNINEGVSLTTFIGHGSVSLWYAAKQNIFTSYDVASLNNPGRYSFVLALNCLNGFFSLPAEGVSGGFDMPLGESLLKEVERGAYGVWTVSAFGFASDYVPLSKELFTNIFRRRNLILGSATTNAKISAVTGFGKDPENLDVLILLGDPASSMNIDVSDDSIAASGGDNGGVSSAESKPGGGCFIATAAFGSPLSPYVQTLREFRDNILLNFSSGKRFVNLYYTYSPPIAHYIEQHEFLKLLVRIVLVPVIGIAWFIMHVKLYYSLLLLFLF